MTTTSWSQQRRGFPKALRRRILQRDPTCRHCHQAPSTEADHIIPAAEGGADTITNGQGLCANCHNIKTRAEIARGRARRPSERRARRHHPGLR